MAGQTAGYLLSGIIRMNNLAPLLPEFTRFTQLSRWPKRVDAVIGWGLKPTSEPARQYARKHALPYIALEDGFLRSLGLGADGYHTHSLVVDHSGIYYDASRPSDLETLIREAPFSADELARAQHAMALLARHRLSKYNHAPDRPLHACDRPRVLVVDQTRGDASIQYGVADADTFDSMFECALAEHPEADILVKVHPDVIAGKKQGHLLEAARQHPRCQLIGEDVNPWALFDAVDAVHVVTSQLGFEALMAGKPVTCHGLPFYAGWGLTRDRQNCPRRAVERSLAQVFAAAFLRYSRYANPYTGEPTTLESTIALISDQRRQHQRLAGNWHAGAFTEWKRGFVDDFLGKSAQVTHHDTLTQAAHAGQPGDNLLAWSSQVDTALENDCEARQLSLWRMEDGFIRSVGLGTDLTRPLSLVLDSQGIYYDPGQPSDLERLLNDSDFDAELLARAAALRERLVRLKLSKYNVAGQQLPALPEGKRRILVPGQVETDASIQRGSPDVRTNSALLAAVRERHPDACILYKPHPDVLTGARVGLLDDTARRLYDLDVGTVAISDLLEVVDEVHTMSSLTGFEALLRGRRVSTYGMPFYAGWGLTEDRQHNPRRQRKLSLDALVAGTLLLYPGYVDPASGQLCNAETTVTLLEKQRARGASPSLKTWLYRWYRNTFIGRR
ncbi:capsular polysaccharide biosynthesis protein [Halomonas urumqiensis]|uniref:Beta-3-deoxy-D-manno-oct-2-ulosonic acid transferase n=1 Tax=Halomonas urumqiensis TaxID=1684789 RepID=A0A2N7UCP8_9GAMM|nr:capsular polysaccharide biosynthesis protein [Halomonas urumqiensis]PMR78161.1 beta-3-deoxy-D-manno-oct-2-ulosonic acid transferase [Halomonas urumqiensis]PTB03310.1 capsular polysaccharide biosynthesis protein [Halomonas urumqiensis]GHE20527.1 capsule polysaccharide modification protein LipA [Halomonas urumqiensis]